MPSRESCNLSMEHFVQVTTEFLYDLLSDAKEPPLILDVRSQQEFSVSHIERAINAFISPGIQLRRFKKGNLSVASIIQDNVEKERFEEKCKTNTVIIYDDSSREFGTNSSSLACLILKKLRQEGIRAYCLQGGYVSFQDSYPEYCVKDEDKDSFRNTIMALSTMSLNPSKPESSTPTDMYPVQVVPFLYLGNAKTSSNLDSLEKLGIKYILNVTTNVPNVFENAKGFKYMQIPISDHWSQNLSSFFPQAIEFIDEAREQECGVLVHCLAGISRSVTITLAYLMQKFDMSLNEAYDFVKKSKPNIAPNFNFLGQLLDFEKYLTSPKDSNYEQQFCPSPSELNENEITRQALESLRLRETLAM